MAENTLTIPAEYVELFRLATAEEIGSDARWAVEQAEEMSRNLLQPDKPMCADMRGPVRHLTGVVAIMDELDASSPTEVEVHGEAVDLAHLAEAMAGIVNSRIAVNLNVSPFDARQLDETRPLFDALGWATGQAAKFHEISHAEIRAGKAGVV